MNIEKIQSLISNIKEQSLPTEHTESIQENYDRQIVALTKQITKLKTCRSEILSRLQPPTKSKQSKRQQKITSEKNEKLHIELNTINNEMEKMHTYLDSLCQSIQEELQTLTPNNRYISEQFLSQLDNIVQQIDRHESTHISR